LGNYFTKAHHSLITVFFCLWAASKWESSEQANKRETEVTSGEQLFIGGNVNSLNIHCPISLMYSFVSILAFAMGPGSLAGNHGGFCPKMAMAMSNIEGQFPDTPQDVLFRILLNTQQFNIFQCALTRTQRY
jgi:hypothetical protein